ncbi:hypothetical protein KDM41_09380 [bacterium]|nr:hypothetical protein [bacterium]
MPRTLCPTPTPRCRTLDTAPGPDRPFGYHLCESLLEARRGSMFPTNGAGPDEDVNVYLAALLARFLAGDHDPRVAWGAGPLLAPPPKTWSRRERAAWYRANADHRLLHLGLCDRGDGLRRRPVLAACTAAENRSRDLAAGAACYEVAANLLRGRGLENRAAVAVLDKLAARFDDYVHVLAATETRRLGLGARLDAADLDRLVPAAATADAAAVADLLQAPPPPAALDALLDLWGQHRENPGPGTASRLRDMATRLGVRLDLD